MLRETARLLSTDEADAPEVEEGAAEELERDWRSWLKTLFAGYLTDSDGDFVSFAEEHAELWEWIWRIRRGKRPRPFIGVWPRGYAKSTTAEMGVCALGARKARSYVLYVCQTQDQADDHVKNVGELLEGMALGAYYPDLTSRRMTKYGHSDGWRRNRLRTESGLTIDAMGLDSSRRGAKVGKDRPDLIILDDLDSEQDTPQTTEKKIRTLTERILPSGSDGMAVLAVQNKVHDNSIFARLSDGRADFLADRIVSGPVKAVDNLEYEQRGSPGRHMITGGAARWAGMDLKRCQEIIDTEGISAFLKERQNEVEAPSGGMYDHVQFERCAWDEVPWATVEQITVWVDPAVTNTDSSDSHGIQADARASGGKIYRLYSWEGRTSPKDALKRAILKAVEIGATTVGVETDQGGDLWRDAHREAVRELVEEGLVSERQTPAFRSAKAGAGHGSKIHRGSLMLADYERGRFIHVRGTHDILERALKRFPKTKPLDLADVCLVANTPVLTKRGEIAIQQVQPEDWVLTRAGYRRVRAAGMTKPNADVVEVEFSDGRTLRGTANHPVWTVEEGWKPLGELDGLSAIINPCPASAIPSKLSTTGEFTSGIPTRTKERIASITSRPDPGRASAKCCTDKCGLTTTGRSPKARTSTISTAIRSTTRRIISSASRSRSIGVSTEIPASARRRKDASIWSASARRLLSGIAARKAEDGTPSTASRFGKTERAKPTSAECAARSSRAATLLALATAPRSAAMLLLSMILATWSSASASSVKSHSRRPSTANADSALPRAVTATSTRSAGRADVYNLSVEDQEEYFAGGILVHNCYWSWHDLDVGGEPASSESDSAFGGFDASMSFGSF